MAYCLQFNIQLKRFERFEIFKKQMIFHIFTEISSNIFSPNTHGKEKRPVETEKVSHPSFEIVVAQSLFLVQK